MSQTEFIHALLDPNRDVPEGLLGADGQPTRKRFNVYRNNVAVSLTEALEQGFPALRALIGDTRFKALAGLYLRAEPPSDPRMMLYGAGMADFLPTVEPLRPYPYLADVARLEYALRLSYHAGDARTFEPPQTEDLASARAWFAPSVQLVQSDFPVHAIWRKATDPEAPNPGAPEDVLITRPAFDPVAIPLTKAQGASIKELMAGASLGGLDDPSILVMLIENGALTRIGE